MYHRMSIVVPVFIPDIRPLIDAHVGWCQFWLQLLTPQKHEVVEFPLTPRFVPDEQSLDLEDIPEGVVVLRA